MRSIAARSHPILAVACVTALIGCTQPTPYQPATFRQPGFSETAIEGNRFQVRVTGNRATSQAVLERQLLFRAAQITLDNGFDWFRIVSRAGDPRLSSLDAGPLALGETTRASRRHRRGRSRFRFGFGFGFPLIIAPYPYYRDPYYYRPLPPNEAVAEIQVFDGPKPADDPAAYSATAVVEWLGPVLRAPS
ncbi:MAG: hypothetical protein AAGI34_05125 [Pseudomonadota bacterium]